MIYIDDYNNTAILDKLPFTKKTEANKGSNLDSVDPGMSENAFRYFWFLMGATIADHYESIDKILVDKYQIVTTDPADAASAVTDMYGSDRFVPFLKDIYPLIEDTVEGNYPNIKVEETGFVGALIAGIAAVVSGGLALAGKAKEKQGASAIAKSNALLGVSAVMAEKEKARLEQIKQQGEERKVLIIGIIVVILISMIIAGFVIYNRNKS